MPLYNYTARDAEGKKVTGSMEAANESALISKLHQQRLMVLSISEQKKGAATAFDFKTLFPKGVRPLGAKGVKLATILTFTTQLSAMISAGLPLAQSLRSLAADVKDPHFQKILHRVDDEVREGRSFSNALEKYPHVFNKIFVNLVRAGESSGKLGQILGQLAAYLENAYTLRRKVKAALTYPLVVASFALLVVLFLVVKIIPKFQGIYRSFGKELPLPTKILLGISTQVEQHFFLAVFLLLLAGAALFVFSRTEQGRFMLDRLKLNLPVFGPIIKKSIVASFSRTLSVLVGSGIPLVPAMRLATQSIDNRVIAQNLSAISTAIERGAGIGECFRTSGFFPEMMVQMVATGEKTGTIDEMVLKAADFYDKQVDTTLSTLTTLLEPLIIIAVGLVVGGIMMAMFLPVFKMGGTMH